MYIVLLRRGIDMTLCTAKLNNCKKRNKNFPRIMRAFMSILSVRRENVQPCTDRQIFDYTNDGLLSEYSVYIV